MDLEMQVELFRVALEELEGIGHDLISQHLGVTPANGKIEVVTYVLA